MATLAASPASVSCPVVVLVEDPQGSKVFQFPTEENAAEFEDKARATGGATLRLLPPAPPSPSGSATTLFAIEDHLSALADSEELIEPAQEQAFLADFQAALLTAQEKRDRVGQFFAHLDSQVDLADKEITRLKQRKAFYEHALGRMEAYVCMVIVSQGPDAKGKYPKLEGHTVTFRVQRNPPSVTVANEEAVLPRFKTVTVTLAAEAWENIADSLPFEMRDQVLEAVKRAEMTVSKTLVKAAIEETVPDWKDRLKDQSSVFAENVPGAAITAGALRLVRS